MDKSLFNPASAIRGDSLAPTPMLPQFFSLFFSSVVTSRFWLVGLCCTSPDPDYQLTAQGRSKQDHQTRQTKTLYWMLVMEKTHEI
jgi:hypothetical protein